MDFKALFTHALGLQLYWGLNFRNYLGYHHSDATFTGKSANIQIKE